MIGRSRDYIKSGSQRRLPGGGGIWCIWTWRVWLQAEKLDHFSELREQVSGRVGPVGQPTSLEICSSDVYP